MSAVNEKPRRPLTIFVEFSLPLLWRPAWFNERFKGELRFKRVAWLFLSVAWIRMELYDFNRWVAGGNTEWRQDRV